MSPLQRLFTATIQQHRVHEGKLGWSVDVESRYLFFDQGDLVCEDAMRLLDGSSAEGSR